MKKTIRVSGVFLVSGDYQTKLKIFFKDQIILDCAKLSHSTLLILIIKLQPKYNQQTFFVS